MSCSSHLLQENNYFQSKLFYVKFCTSQSGRQLSSCYSHPWFLGNFVVSLTVFLFFRIVLLLLFWLFLVTQLLHTECFSWARKKIFSCCYDWQLSSFFNLNPSNWAYFIQKLPEECQMNVNKSSFFPAFG